MSDATVILQMICPDRPGLVSELAGWVAANGGSIRHADHHTDAGAGLFLSRIEWQLQGFGIPRDVLPEAAQSLGQRLGGEAQLHFSDDHPRVAIFASKQSHCLQDLLWRAQSGELPMQVPLVIANHPDLEPLCASFGIPFVCVPVSRDTKAEAEQRILELLEQNKVELAVLAKYMQVLSSDFLERFPQVINIHIRFCQRSRVLSRTTVPGIVGSSSSALQPTTSPKIWMTARSLSKPPFPSAIGTKWRI